MSIELTNSISAGRINISKTRETNTSAVIDSITTNEILLSPLNNSIEAMRLEAVCESQMLLQEHFSWCKLPYDANQNERYIQQAEHFLHHKKAFLFCVLHKNTNTYLGEVGIDWISEDSTRVNVVYWIRKTYSGKGYATSAVKLLLLEAPQFITAKYAEIIMETGNWASKRIAEKVGAQYIHEVKNDATAKGELRNNFYFHYYFK